jgi:hypothetical protein
MLTGVMLSISWQWRWIFLGLWEEFLKVIIPVWLFLAFFVKVDMLPPYFTDAWEERLILYYFSVR